MKKILLLVLMFVLVACGTTNKEAEDDNSEIVKKEDIKKDDDGFTIVEPGYEVQLATLKMMPLGYEEYDIDSTKKGDAVKLTVTNTTKSPFDFSGMTLQDDQDRVFTMNDDSFSFDDNLWYQEIAPDIPETGYLYFIVPIDSKGYWSGVSHAETEKTYKIMYEVQE